MCSWRARAPFVPRRMCKTHVIVAGPAGAPGHGHLGMELHCDGGTVARTPGWGRHRWKWQEAAHRAQARTAIGRGRETYAMARL
jgi:hypothetical protein